VRGGRQLHFARAIAALGVERGGAKRNKQGKQSGAKHHTEASKTSRRWKSLNFETQ
jgi:hypothetical protein